MAVPKFRETLLASTVIVCALLAVAGSVLWLRHKYNEAQEFRQRIIAGKTEAEIQASEGLPIWTFGPGEEAKLVKRLKNSGCQPLPNLPIEGKALLYIRSLATYLTVYLDRKGRVTSVFTSQT